MAAQNENKVAKILNTLPRNVQNSQRIISTYTSGQEIDLQLSLGGSYNKNPIENPMPQPFLGIPFANSEMVPISYLGTSNVTYKEMRRSYENEQRPNATIVQEHRITPRATNNPVFRPATENIRSLRNNRSEDTSAIYGMYLILSFLFFSNGVFFVVLFPFLLMLIVPSLNFTWL